MARSPLRGWRGSCVFDDSIYMKMRGMLQVLSPDGIHACDGGNGASGAYHR